MNVVLSPSDLLHAGAYRVCYERFDPDNCTTRQHLAAIDHLAIAINQWAEDQPDGVKTAYLLASADVRKRAIDRLENQERGMACAQAYVDIPKPP